MKSKPSEKDILDDLTVHAISGKKIDLNVAPVREIVRVEHNGKYIKTFILSVEYSGSIEDEPFAFHRYYSMPEDASDNALDHILVANKRFIKDFQKLKEAGIDVNDQIIQDLRTHLDPNVATNQ